MLTISHTILLNVKMMCVHVKLSDVNPCAYMHRHAHLVSMVEVYVYKDASEGSSMLRLKNPFRKCVLTKHKLIR